MAVIEQKRANGVAYRIAFWWRGKRVFEHGGTDVREARRLNARRLREVRAGTYTPPKQRKATLVGQYAATWIDGRENRNADDEQKAFHRLVIGEGREWFADLPLMDVRPRHILRLIQELKKTPSLRRGAPPGEPLGEKTVKNIYGNVRTMFRDARIAELVDSDPCVLPRGTFKGGKSAQREPYTEEEIRALVTSEAIEPDQRVFNALLFYTGERIGEAAGRRWRNWDRATRPLTALTVDTQYDDQPLKTADKKGEQPRIVPVHPDLAALLTWWWNEGFEWVYCRKPTPDDFIVPQRDGTNRTKSTIYKTWTRHSCPRAGVRNRSVHSTRHTFITLARRGGARKEGVLERVTHNAKGDIVDRYTHWDWAPLCEAVLCFRPLAPASNVVMWEPPPADLVPPRVVRTAPRIALLGMGEEPAMGAALGAVNADDSKKQVEAPGIEVGLPNATKQNDTKRRLRSHERRGSRNAADDHHANAKGSAQLPLGDRAPMAVGAGDQGREPTAIVDRDRKPENLTHVLTLVPPPWGPNRVFRIERSGRVVRLADASGELAAGGAS